MEQQKTKPQSEAAPVSKPDTRELKTADKPHKITIGLGLLSPSLAVLALVVSLFALHESERTLQIGQRAYVSLQNGRITFGQMTAGPPPQPTSSLRNDEPQPNNAVANGQAQPDHFVAMLLTVTLVNTGNTPAQFVRFTPTYNNLPEGWTIRKQEYKPKDTTPPYLGPKAQALWRYRQSFELTREAWSQFSTAGVMNYLHLSGDLLYEDVFGKRHAVNWCWDTFANERNNGEVTDCLVLEKDGQ